ncbi:hypothetical protein AC249_AIPGENE23494 [Exaiptasia diaphana]|nr:hypothetical protein AC249_AIPGENE23494 [Exaiptasia diaphana]
MQLEYSFPLAQEFVETASRLLMQLSLLTSKVTQEVLPPIPETPGYVPALSDASSDEEDVSKIKSNLETLNTYLESRDVSPVRAQLRTTWENASVRTRRYYTRKAGQAVASVVCDISPIEASPLFRAITSSQMLRRPRQVMKALKMRM